MLSSCFRRTTSALRSFTIVITKSRQYTISSTLQRPVFNFLRSQTHPPSPSHWKKYVRDGKINTNTGSPSLFLTAKRRFYCNEGNQGGQFRDTDWCKRILQNRRKVCKVIAYGVVACTVITSGGVAAILYFRDTETIPYTKRRHYMLFPISSEISIGDEWFESMKKEELKEKILPATHPHSVRVDLIFSNIIKAMRKELVYEQNGKQREAMAYLDELNWEVLVIDEPIYEANAYSKAGGKIVVSTGFLEEFTTDGEIATVIGHEIAHCVARHSTETFTKAWLSVRYRWVLDMFGVSDERAVRLLWPSSSLQRNEIEADFVGMLLMAAAGYDPRIAPGFYIKLAGYRNTGAETDTTPPDEERARLLSQPIVVEEALTLYRKFHQRKHLGDRTEHIAGGCARQEEALQLQLQCKQESALNQGEKSCPCTLH